MPDKGGRKIYMFNVTVGVCFAIGVIYMGIMYNLGQAPDPMIMTALLTVIGAGIATANIANGHEHKNND